MVSEMIRFFLPMEPPTATVQGSRSGKTKDGRPYRYKPAELTEVEQKFRAHLWPHRPEAPLVGPVRLITRWIWTAKNRHKSGHYKPTKPDTDNVLKLFKDSMTKAGFWGDDAQVASELTEKFWGETPGIFVQVEEIEE